jgi:hypothetical protein
MPLVLRIAAFAFLMFGVSACGETSNVLTAGTPAPATTRAPLTTPAVAGLFTPQPGSAFFGAFVNTTGLLNGSTPEDVALVEQQLGRQLLLHMTYLAFTESLSNNKLLDDFVNYRVPIVSWNCQYPDATIASGQYDLQINLAATQAKNFGGPMFVSYFWSPNLPTSSMQDLATSRLGCWSPEAGDLPKQIVSPTQFIAAWQHIHSIFDKVGATNVIWLWIVSSDPNSVAAMPYYPGNQWVDWVGMNSFDSNGGSFSSTFSNLYSTLAPLNKPIMISQTGAVAAQQQSFFSSAVPTLQSQFPLVKAFCYYDSVDYIINENADWRVSAAAFPAFAALANSPYMAGTYAH